MDGWLLGFSLGVLSSPWLNPAWPGWLIPLTMLMWGTIAICLNKFTKVLQTKRQASYVPIIIQLPALFCMGVLCGMQWSLINAKAVVSANLSDTHIRQTIPLQIRIVSIVENNSVRLRFNAKVVATASTHQEHVNADYADLLMRKLNLQWYGFGEAAPRLGETWLVHVRLRPVASLQNQSSFNYQAYLFRHRINATGYVQDGERINSVSLSSTPISWLRQSIFDNFSQHRTYLRHADLLLALSIAERHWVTRESWQVLQHAGVAHLMAISGLHLSMLFGASLLLGRYFSSRLARLFGRAGAFNLLSSMLVFAWAVATIYAALAGFSIATMRALLLISLFTIARLGASYQSPQRVLLRAIVILFLLDPLAFLDAGFWLSCFAVYAIFVWVWRLPHHFPATRWQQVRQLWRLEVMLTMALIPVTLWFFSGVPWVAPLSNMLLVPVFSVLLLPFTLVSVLLIPWWPALSYALLASADQILQWFWPLLNKLAAVGFWQVQPAITGLLVTLLWLLWYVPVSRRRRIQAQVLVGVSVTLLTVVQPHLKALDPRVWLHVLDVGQGSALLVEKQGRALIIDSGPGYGGAHLAGSIIVPFINARGLRPDLMVLTHGHWDHIGGADYLKHQYPNMTLVDTEGRGWPCEWGRAWAWQGISAHFLAPVPMAIFQGVNNQSCVLQLRWQDQSVLLPGDVERLGEFRLVRHYGAKLRSQVLLVPHHGSRTSSHEYFLSQVQPEWALISSGYLNRFNMPHPESIARLENAGAQIFNTADHGQLSLLWYRNEWHLRTQRAHFSPYWFNQHR